MIRHIDLGGGEDYSPPLTTTGNPKIGFFDYKEELFAGVFKYFDCNFCHFCKRRSIWIKIL